MRDLVKYSFPVVLIAIIVIAVATIALKSENNVSGADPSTEGYEAAAIGMPPTACQYTDHYPRRRWLEGWQRGFREGREAEIIMSQRHYNEGKSAGALKWSAQSCPYTTESLRRMSWLTGWAEAQIEIQKAAAAAKNAPKD